MRLAVNERRVLLSAVRWRLLFSRLFLGRLPLSPVLRFLVLWAMGPGCCSEVILIIGFSESLVRTNGIYEECAGHGADEGLSWVDGYFKYFVFVWRVGT
jgi:hypothetical protein